MLHVVPIALEMCITWAQNQVTRACAWAGPGVAMPLHAGPLHCLEPTGHRELQLRSLCILNY